MRNKRHFRVSHAFTLAELLIALAILGVIATFTIPKVLQAQQDARLNSIAMEAAGSLSEAYQLHKASHEVTATTKAADLTPYMNYVRLDTSGTSIDWLIGWAPIQCNSSNPCLHLHNGGILLFRWPTFGGTNSTNAISFVLDPDGQVTPDGSVMSVMFFMYPNGLLRTRGTTLSGTKDGEPLAWPATPSQDPPWFHWN